jgi:hypothetical protein
MSMRFAGRDLRPTGLLTRKTENLGVDGNSSNSSGKI